MDPFDLKEIERITVRRTDSETLGSDAILKMLDAFIDKCGQRHIDVVVKCDVATECCWGTEMKVIQHPNRRDGPDRGVTFFTGGGDTPMEGVLECLRAIASAKDLGPVSTIARHALRPSKPAQ